IDFLEFQRSEIAAVAIYVVGIEVVKNQISAIFEFAKKVVHCAFGCRDLHNRTATSMENVNVPIVSSSDHCMPQAHVTGIADSVPANDHVTSSDFLLREKVATQYMHHCYQRANMKGYGEGRGSPRLRQTRHPIQAYSVKQFKFQPIGSTSMFV
nr:cyclin-D3-1 [Tanacetum cinerariifolium]